MATTRRMGWMGTIVLVGCTLAVLGGCSSGDDDSDAASAATTSPAALDTFVGKVEGTDVAVATVVDGDAVLVYLCDGSNGRRIDGQANEGTFESEVDGLGTVSLDITETEVTGSVTADGSEHPIVATRATGDAAFLWAEGQDDAGEPISAEWVVAPDGSETGGVVAGITDGTSNTIRLTTGGSASNLPSHQSDIIAILIGVRAPLTGLR